VSGANPRSEELLASCNEEVGIIVDGVPQERPRTAFL
jgi:hypothetical protein